MPANNKESRLQPVVHIGFPKTGTTTHQNHLFAKHPEVFFLGKPYGDDTFKTLMHRLIKEESTTYDPEPLKSYIRDITENGPAEKALVVSDEIMVSVSKVRDKGVVAGRLLEIFPGAKIIVTIRNQLDILKSTYVTGCRLLTQVPGKYKGRFVPFSDWLEFSFEYHDRTHVGNFVYLNTIDYYSRLFGRENVKVLLFEDFIHNKDAYVEELAQFMGIDAEASQRLLEGAHDNERMEQSRLDFEQFLGSRVPIKGSRTVYRVSRAFRSLSGKKQKARVEIPQPWLDRINAYYAAKNRDLAEQYNLPLKQYGYPV